MGSKAELLKELEKARAAIWTEPVESRRLAERVLDRAHEVPELLSQILTRVGAARQVCGDRDGARSAFGSASNVEKDRVERGLIICRWAILELESHNPEEALEKACLGVALVEGGDPTSRQLAKGVLARAMVYRQIGLCSDAETDIRRSLCLIHPKRDSDLYYRALHNLTLALLFGKRDVESVRVAMQTFDEVKWLLRKYRVPHKSCQYAMVLWGQGLANRLAGAEERTKDSFCRAQEIFLDIKAITEWLRVSLDLLELYMHHQQWGRVKSLAAEMLRYANDTETVAVLQTFYLAVRGERIELTEEILTAVYTKIHGDARRVPQLVTPQDIDELDVEPLGW